MAWRGKALHFRGRPSVLAALLISLLGAGPWPAAAGERGDRGTRATTVIQLRAWSAALAPVRDLDALLDAFERSEMPWPGVVSSGFAGELGPLETRRQAAFRDLAGTVARHLAGAQTEEDAAANLDAVPLDTAALRRRHARLLDLRASFLGTPSYVNLLLADLIGRRVAFDIVEAVVRRQPKHAAEKEAEWPRAIVSRLRAQTLNIARLAEIDAFERGIDAFERGGAEPALIDGGASAYRAFLSIAGRSVDRDDEALAAGVLRSTFTDLLAQQNVIGWLFRLRQGDTLIQLALPMAVDFVARQGGATDGEVASDQVLEAVTGDSASAWSYGSTLSPWRFEAAAEARNLIGRIRRNERRAVMHLGALRPASRQPADR